MVYIIYDTKLRSLTAIPLCDREENTVIFVGRTDPKKFLSIGNSNQFTF